MYSEDHTGVVCRLDDVGLCWLDDVGLCRLDDVGLCWLCLGVTQHLMLC